MTASLFVKSAWTAGLAFLLACALQLTLTPAWAEQPADTDNIHKADEENPAEKKAAVLDAVLVISSKMQTGDVDQQVYTGTSSVIERDSFEGTMESLADVISKVAGVQVRQQGGAGGYSTVSLRGSSSEQVMVYLDGILLNDGSGGGVNLANISLGDVAAIEIYRGVTPVNFGKASIGGAINIRTLRAKEGLTGAVSAGYGSFHTRQASGFINHKPGKFDYLLSVDYAASDNDFEIHNDNGTQYNPNDDRWETRNNAQYESTNFLAKAGYDLSPGLRLDGMNQYFTKRQGLPSWNNSPRTTTSLDTQRNITTLKLAKDDFSSLHLNGAFRLDYYWLKEEYDDSRNGIGLGKQHNIYRTKRYGSNFFLEWPGDFQVVSLSADLRYEQYCPEDLIKQNAINDSNRLYFSAALQDRLILLQERLIITPTLRYTALEDQLESAVNYWGRPLPSRQRQSNYFSPQIGAKHQTLDWLSFKSNVSRYVREPNFFELFGDRGFLVGNDELEAEKGVNFDIGFELENPPALDFFDRFFFRTVYFQSNVDDIIVRVYDARGVGKSKNISHANISGVEAQLNLEFLSFFRLSFNATWQDTENDGEVVANKSKQLPGRYRDAYYCRLEAFYKSVNLYGEYQGTRGMFYDSANLLPAADKNIYNAGITYAFWEYRLNFEVQNLTDSRYEDFNGFPASGSSYYVNLSYRF